ncbi:hypothetical protein Scep_025579 [Stephania cephalantha]|uniref:Reverse transcriptase/retrotransposon-derived protein RNase H-like domain-containing protein n=1 Tax=Stephania cephalantha TaxID=152367 RepID=A0AAP0HSK2_9MAGN
MEYRRHEGFYSSQGISAVLSQNKLPLAFFSKKLCPRLQSSSAYSREMYAIAEAVKTASVPHWPQIQHLH